MKSNIVVIPHTVKEIQDFAETIGCDIEHAKYIEYMRGVYLSWEHDYVEEPKAKGKRKKRIST